MSIMNELKEKYGITHVAKCECGAYTVTIEGMDYSVSPRNFDKFFPINNRKALSKAVKQKFGNCNHCVNHWGLDLCGCGSGEPFGNCSNTYAECKNPAQSVEYGYNHISANNRWGF